MLLNRSPDIMYIHTKPNIYCENSPSVPVFFSVCVVCVYMALKPSPLCFIQSDLSGLQNVAYLPVGACIALLPAGVLRHHGDRVLFFRRCIGRRLYVHGDAAGFGDGRVGVVVKVVVGERCFTPAGFAPGRFTLKPLPPHCCLSLHINSE